MITVGHTQNGTYFELHFGGADVPPTQFFNYQRTALATETIRAMPLEKISIGTTVLGTGTLLMTIENNIPGLLYKTKDQTKIEALRQSLAAATETEVSFKMSGPMVQQMNF